MAPSTRRWLLTVRRLIVDRLAVDKAPVVDRIVADKPPVVEIEVVVDIGLGKNKVVVVQQVVVGKVLSRLLLLLWMLYRVATTKSWSWNLNTNDKDKQKNHDNLIRPRP